MTKDELKQAYSDLMAEVLNGSNPHWRLSHEQGSFIRWGRVEKAVYKLIDEAFAAQPAPAEAP